MALSPEREPQIRAELRDRRTEDLNLRGLLAPDGQPRRVPMELGASLVPAVEWLLEELDRVRALVAMATVLEIPRKNDVPLQLRLSYGHADRWSICDRTGRRWDRELGWAPEFGGIVDDARRDSARFTLAEALPLAHRLAADAAVVPAAGDPT